jgi:hypothetical protein
MGAQRVGGRRLLPVMARRGQMPAAPHAPSPPPPPLTCQADLVAMTAGYTEAAAAMYAAVVQLGGFPWQAFLNNATNAGPLVGQATCASDLRSLCGNATITG